MCCSKCGGLLVAERFLDFYSCEATWKCVNCGRFHTESPQVQSLIERATSCRSREPEST